MTSIILNDDFSPENFVLEFILSRETKYKLKLDNTKVLSCSQTLFSIYRNQVALIKVQVNKY